MISKQDCAHLESITKLLTLNNLHFNITISGSISKPIEICLCIFFAPGDFIEFKASTLNKIHINISQYFVSYNSNLKNKLYKV